MLETKEVPVSEPPLIKQGLGVVTTCTAPSLVMVHVLESEGKPDPVIEIVCEATFTGVTIVIVGSTAKEAEPESTTGPVAGQLTVIV